MRKLVIGLVCCVLSFCVVRVALGDPAPDAGITVSDASVAVGSGAGSAAPLPLPDPVADPGAALSTVERLYKSGALVDVGILVAFFLLTVAAAKVPWLKEDHRAVIVAAALGGLALLAVPAAAGTTPNLSQLLGAVVVAIGLAVNPKKAAQA